MLFGTQVSLVVLALIRCLMILTGAACAGRASGLFLLLRHSTRISVESGVRPRRLAAQENLAFSAQEQELRNVNCCRKYG